MLNKCKLNVNIMEIKIKKSLKHNSKTTDIRCIRCGEKIKARRNDRKTCSGLCRVQEGKERKEKGYLHRVFNGTKKDLDTFLNKIIDLRSFSHFYNISIEIRNGIKMNDKSNCWKIDKKDFRLVFFPSNKKRPFELYFTQSKKVVFDLHYTPRPITKLTRYIKND